ncbi:MAG: hypothetical protein ISR65_20565, partial [Bacteriovoracaceae bacterium]|nr:hypothetical protein [Bacteriovoracaceae bacterium]
GELLDGIDAFAVSVGHELLHMKHWKSWWNPRGGWPETGRFSVGSNDQCLSTPEPVDKDLDYIPDHLEAGLGYNKNDKFTHRQQYGTGEMWDEHHLTYKGAEVEWTAGQADSEDWSHPGHQWE